MTVSQADTINILYRNYNDTIHLLKDSIKTKTIKYDSLYNKTNQEKDSIYNWKWKYSANKSIYENWQESQIKMDKIHSLSKLLLMGIIILQFSQLNN